MCAYLCLQGGVPDKCVTDSKYIHTDTVTVWVGHTATGFSGMGSLTVNSK